MSKKWGLRFSGLEQEIEKIIVNYLSNSYNKSFKYVEIGAGTGRTMRGIYDIVKNNIKHDNWKVIGTDFCDGWSLDWNEVNKSFNQDELEIWTNRLSGWPFLKKLPNAQLWLDKNPRELLSDNLWFDDIDICLIDGEHSKQEFIKDPTKKIGDLVKEVIAKTGENVRVGRIFRVELGE